MALKDLQKEIGKAGKTVTSAANKLGDAFGDTLENLSDEAKKAVSGLAKDADKIKVNANTRDEMFKKICGIIPNKINNETVVNALDLMRKQQKMLKKDFSANLKKNQETLKKHLEHAGKKADGYVEDQNAYTDVAYGDATMQFSGCEIFATYNAIRNIAGKATANLANMISEYEKDGMVLSGKFGTAPKAIKDYLEKKGFKTEMTTDEKKFDEIGKRHQSVILTMYNDKNDISKEVHTVNISKEGGKYTAHNVYCNGQVVGPYNSISEVIKNINKGLAKGISLIGVSKK